MEHFLKEIRDHFQLRYFYKNIEQLESCKSVKEAKVKMLEADQLKFLILRSSYNNKYTFTFFTCTWGSALLQEFLPGLRYVLDIL